MAHDVVRGVAWPYPGSRFPRHLGVVAQRTVLEGTEPARSVVDDAEGDWLVSDGVNDPNGNAVLVCMEHLVAADGTIAPLAAMPPGTEVWRASPDEPWRIQQHTYADA
ncbi:hypothetical protein [Micromonospora sp. HK10]|uniref:hypothetical protein n=1 Tax=Micromonospora sp. HK10 TaxID=1538294 RepID=UPI000AAE7377|nr:hypothetical protein [Micromonospora sp. HK10]